MATFGERIRRMTKLNILGQDAGHFRQVSCSTETLNWRCLVKAATMNLSNPGSVNINIRPNIHLSISEHHIIGPLLRRSRFHTEPPEACFTRTTRLVQVVQMDTVHVDVCPCSSFAVYDVAEAAGRRLSPANTLTYPWLLPQWIRSGVDQDTASTNPATETDKPCFSGVENKTRLCRGPASESKHSKRSASLLDEDV